MSSESEEFVLGIDGAYTIAFARRAAVRLPPTRWHCAHVPRSVRAILHSGRSVYHGLLNDEGLHAGPRDCQMAPAGSGDAGMDAVTARAPDPDQIVAALVVRDSRVLLCDTGYSANSWCARLESRSS